MSRWYLAIIACLAGFSQAYMTSWYAVGTSVGLLIITALIIIDCLAVLQSTHTNYINLLLSTEESNIPVNCLIGLFYLLKTSSHFQTNSKFNLLEIYSKLFIYTIVLNKKIACIIKGTLNIKR